MATCLQSKVTLSIFNLGYTEKLANGRKEADAENKNLNPILKDGKEFELDTLLDLTMTV